MDISFRGHITDAVKHRYVTGLNVSSETLDNKVIDVLVPTYVADHTPVNNFKALTISPMNATLIGAESIPFNNLIRLAGIDMKRFKKELQILKEKELTFVSVGYGGLSINMLHFLSMLAYRVDTSDIFKNLHIYENDNLSFTNIMRLYKDITKLQCEYAERVNKTVLFDEENLASNIYLHQYYLHEESIGDIGDDVVFFGAPDFDTREMLSRYNFIFGGHTGDEVAFMYRPKIDSDLTMETYGSINLTSFMLNMMKATEHLVYALASDDKYEDDALIFKYNAKDAIRSEYNADSSEFGNGIASYKINDRMSIVI